MNIRSYTMKETVLVMTVWLFIFIKTTDAGITSLWDFCGCRWNEWQAWGDCSAECNGFRSRRRSVRLYTSKDGCPFEFETCATGDMSYDYSRCNEFCYNGGTSYSYYCSCLPGFYGSCCGFQINCGDPGSLANGQVHGSSFTYGSTVSYTCNTDYMLMDGSNSRTCQITHTWSGTKPYCAFYESCRSSPCQNGATCSNIPDDYTCLCQPGWSGKNCETDVQPPLMANCSDGISVHVSELQIDVTWEVPVFWDLHGFTVDVTSNYPTNTWMFPWGDFKVVYSAVKPSNGLKNECIIDVTIRPYPCEQLSAPLNGAVVCSNWHTDYGQICTSVCNASFTVPRGFQSDQWIVCGATGSWVPISIMPNCTVSIDDIPSTNGYYIGSSFENCLNDTQHLQLNFINLLKVSSFSHFCDMFPHDCRQENVLVICN